MSIKLQVGDDSPENKRRKVASSGGYVVENNKTGDSSIDYPKSGTTSFPITKNAQYAGAGASTVWTQPMFFSPLHTPQNWQIASKRREAYQWCRFYYCFTPDNYVLMADGTEKKILDVKEGDFIIAGDGTKRKVQKVNIRHTEEDIVKIKVWGINREIKTTFNHSIPRVPLEKWVKSDATTPSKRRKRERLKQYEDVVLDKVWDTAKSLEIGDRLFTPKDDGLYRAVVNLDIEPYKGEVYDLSIEGEHSYCVNRCVVHNSNEPKVAAGVDFYSEFPLSGFKLECRNRKILKYYENLVEKLELAERLNDISHEYFLLGDVFPFLEIKCKRCGGKGVTIDGQKCRHEDGTFSDIKILNPDYIEVESNALSNTPSFYLVPDEELKQIVQRKRPKEIYEKLPTEFIALVSSGNPIPLSSRCTTHLKHNASPYGNYGTPIIQRMFTMLAYKTKIMTANWIIAERLILPIRVVKVGDKDRPAQQDDIQDVVNQLSAVANDPNLTVVTHHAFDYEWYGACHAKETEILTNNGFKLFNELNPNDLVASYNKNTGFITFVKPLEYHEYDFNGELIRFKHKSLDISVTPNHKMLVERNGKLIEVQAKDVIHNDKFISTAKWEGFIPDILPFKNSPLSHLTLEEYLKFVGYYISEGGCKIENNRNFPEDKKIQACGITQKIDSEHYSDIENICKKVNPNVWTHIDDRGNVPILTFMFNSSIARYLSDEFGANSATKNIPTWIKNLPSEYLSIIYQSMMNGDGSIRFTKLGSKRSRYNTVSKKLSDDFSEILLKMGYFSNIHLEKAKNENCNDIYRISFAKNRKSTKFTIRNKNISREKYNDKVYCVTVDSGFIVTRYNGKLTIQGNSGKIHNVTQEIEQIGKEVLDGFMLNQAILNGEMSSYSSAQVGVEVLIKRLESWRNKLKRWVERHIFLPVAMMQGFIDEKESEMIGEAVYLYPEIIWNDLNLRDNTNKIQTMIQLYDKGLVSADTILEELGLDYDTEIEKRREEDAVASATGMMPGAGGDMMGGMGGLGGMSPMGGGAPMGDVGGMEGDMGGLGGMEGMGEMGGIGADMGAGGMGGMEGAAASSLPKITKRGKGKQDDTVQQPQMKKFNLTKLEQKMYKLLRDLNIPYPLYGQYEVQLPREERPFVLDFAYPHIGVGIESDGSIWHQREDFVQRDRLRDQKLANVGWRILRFNEDAIEDHIDAVSDTVYKNIVEAARDIKKRKKTSEKNESSELMEKYSSVYEYLEENKNNIGINVKNLPNNIGKLILIGNIK